MRTPALEAPQSKIAAISAPLAGVIASFLFGIVAWLEFTMGPATAFTLLYLLPVGVAAYFIGRLAGLIASLCAAGAGIAIALHYPSSLAVDCWNAGVRLGVYVIFSTLIDHLHRHVSGVQIARQVYRLLALCIVSAGAMASLGWVAQRVWPATRLAIVDAPKAELRVTMSRLAAQVENVLRDSKPVMLGSRDPAGPSCVTPVKRGELHDKIPASVGDLDGGPGTTMASLYTHGRKNNTTAMLDFTWHQKRLKSHLENDSSLNQLAAVPAHELAEATRRFAEQVESWSSIPTGTSPAGYSRRDNWLSYCMTALDQAIAAQNIALAKHWSGELAEACFSLDDLHQWLALVCENQLTALAFQKQCQGLFEWVDTQNRPYDPFTTISAFPAGLLSLNGWGNYAEIERQAERLFSMMPDRVEEIAQDRNLTSGSLWVPPGMRPAFVKLRGALSSENQKTWDEAARTPYEHSYLISMLFRASASDSLESVATVLGRFDAVHPQATVGELMSVLMYRGHCYAGLEWSDRFDPQLLTAADQIPTANSDAAAFMSACVWTNQHYEGPKGYASTLTLRDALEHHKLDCVRATDMIGAIFRDAGRTGFAHVRWCAGTTAHSVAAQVSLQSETTRTVVVDGLNPPTAPEVWPDCYFQGHAWPAGMESSPTPYAVELYIRGLDNYLWAEGYVVRGPQAGWLTKARLPYSKVRRETTTKKVFEGPHPN